MADTGFITSGTEANDLTIASAWVNLSNVHASDNVYCTAPLDAAVFGLMQTQGGLFTNFGFAIPSGSTILGVEALVERSLTAAVRISDLTIQLIKGGVASGSNKAAAGFWTASDVVVNYGGAADLWALALTDADVNASDFGLKIRAQCTLGAASARLDNIALKVYYDPPAAGADYYVVKARHRSRR